MPEVPEMPAPASPPAASPACPRLECHRIDLDTPLPDTALRWLSAEEEARALRFRFEHLRHRYRVSRVALRSLLAERLSLSPTHVRFITSPKGKPALHPDHASTLQFNLSHSEASGWIVIATQPVGIDVEQRHRPMPEREALLPRVSTPAELQQLHRLAAPWQGPAFFLIWTRKEALLKAWGDGIQGFGSLRRLDTRLPELSGTEAFLDALPPIARSDTGASQIVPVARLPLMQIPHPAHRPDAGSDRQPLWLTSLAVGDEIISVAAPSAFSLTLHPWTLPPCPPDDSLPMRLPA